MNRKISVLTFLIIMTLCLTQVPEGRAANSGSTVKPQKFAPGIISTDAYEMNATFTPDGKMVYFVRAKDVQLLVTTIYVSHLKDGQWSEPQVAEFSGKYNDMDPFVSPDGEHLYFSSNRPLDGGDLPKKDFDIWIMDKTETGWGQPRNLGSPINTERSETHPTVAANGNLYFCKRDSSTQWSLYHADFTDGAYRKPEIMGPEINSSMYNFEPYIDPQERYLIYSQYNYEKNDDQSISYHVNGSWTEAEFLPLINTVNFEICPFVSHDGKTLYFTRTGDIYQIDISALRLKLH